MRRLSLILSLLLAPAVLLAQEEKGPSPKERYETLSAAEDHAGLVALWREVPDAVIPVIDGDLEGSLALFEKEGEAKRAEIDALIDRAIRGARAAVEATGRRRVLDYVTSFAGWGPDEKQRFRRGQAAFREARQHQRAEKWNDALAKGRECRELAEPLGDWWGTAMGLQAEGSALRALGRKDEASVAVARARLIYRELGLTRSALGLEAELAELSLELGRLPRARELVRDGLEGARATKNGRLVTRFEALHQRLAESEGRTGAAHRPGD